MKERIAILTDLDQFVGKYISRKYVRTKVLRQTEDEMEQIDKEMEEELPLEQAEAEMDAMAQEPPPAPPPPPAPTQIVIKKEEVFDDNDQKDLARSMSRFFDVLTEETEDDRKK
jgi:hypothetical protein